MPHVHLIGIGGSGMSGLASLFASAGWVVTGCDKAKVHPPAADTLADAGITPREGYSASHLDPPPDLVVVGNVVRETNPEDRAARAKGLSRLHMASALWRYFISEKTSVVVAGTHGKTTSASLLAFLLDNCGHDPGFFVGGMVRNLGVSARRGCGPFFVTEGDEYDCAWFDKVPKFLHYHPRFLLITNVEFDHADIYPDLDAVVEAFRRLIASMPPDGALVYCAESAIMARLAREAPCRVVSYAGGEHGDGQWRADRIEHRPDSTVFRLARDGASVGEFAITLPGRHNVLNATGVIALWDAIGLPVRDTRLPLARFRGAARRLEVLVEGPIAVIDDFAHHPTEVRASLAAVRHRWQGRAVWAVYEPKTQTSRRRVLQTDLAEALATADESIVLAPHDLDAIPPAERIDLTTLTADIERAGGRGTVVSSQREAARRLLERAAPPAVIVLMSAGSLAELAGLLVPRLVRAE